jgi:hypothetical protein
MAEPRTVDTGFRCPDARCNGAMGRDECGIFCTRCGFEAATWADPVDADVPMNILVARERRALWQRRALLGAGAAAVLSLIGLGLAWPFGSSKATELRELASLSYGELKAGFQSGAIPADWNVPAYYRDPERFLMPRERTAQSVLGPIWQALPREQKLELLEIVKDQESIAYLGAMADIAWYSAPLESDYGVARSMIAALYACTGDVLEVALLVCEFMVQVTPNARVRADAQQFVADLDERRRRLGR